MYVGKFLNSLFIKTNIIKGIWTSAVISDAFPVIKIMFWKVRVTSWNIFSIVSGQEGFFKFFNKGKQISMISSYSSEYWPI